MVRPSSAPVLDIPPPQTHAPTTCPHQGADQGQMYVVVVFGAGAGVRGANVGSRDVNWWA